MSNAEDRVINEVIVDGEDVLSTRSNTVTEDTLMKNKTAQDSSGQSITGNMEDGTHAYNINDSLSNALSENDYIPFYDVSEQKKHNTLLSNLINKIKGMFISKATSTVNIDIIDDTLSLKTLDIDASEIDNAVSEIRHPSTSDILDKEGRTITRFESVVNPDGKIGANLYVQNYDDNGGAIAQKGMQWHMDKHGNLDYQVDDENAFREAIKTLEQVGNIIPANTDLNTVLTAGVYTSLSNANTTTLLNRPMNGMFKMIVMIFNDNPAYVRQVCIAFNSFQTHTRFTTNSGVSWSDWVMEHPAKSGNTILYNFKYGNLWGQLKISTQNKVVAYNFSTDGGSTWNGDIYLVDTNYFQNNTHYLSQPDSVHQISANEDLNNYTASGTYQCSNANIAVTLANCPVTRSFKLIVDRAYTRSESEIMQKITMINSTSNQDCSEWIRVRGYNQSTWGTWKKYVTDPADIGNGYAVGTVNGSAITATIDGFKLKQGGIVAIQINTEITTDCTLNINNTGAKNIRYWNNEVISYGKPLYYGIWTFLYDGTVYRILSKDRTPYVGLTNYVANTSGNIILDWGYNVNRAQIKYDINANRLLWNYYKNNVWRGDINIADYYDLITTSVANEIPSGANFNNYKTAGIYVVKTNAIASSITNCPSGGAGKLIVMYNSSTTNILQIYSVADATTWIRGSYDSGSTWYSWVRLARMSDLQNYLNTYSNWLGVKNIFPWDLHTDIFYNNNPSGTSYASHTISNGIVNVVVNTSSTAAHKGIYIRSTLINEMLSDFNGLSVTFSCDVKCNTSVTNFRFGFDNFWGFFTIGTDYTHIERTVTFDSSLTNNNMIFYIPSTSAYTFSVKNIMVRPAIITSQDYIPFSYTNQQVANKMGNCYVGTCTTAGGTKDKVAYVDGYFVLRKGVRVAIKYSYSNTVNSTASTPVTLNVNNTGAKYIYVNNWHSDAMSAGTQIKYFGCENRYIYYVYDGTYWVWDGTTIDENSTNFLRNDASSTLTASTPILALKASNIDVKQANNGVSSTQYPCFRISDKNGITTTQVESIVQSNGTITAFLYVNNYNTNTQSTFNGGIFVNSNKSGEIWYNLTKPHNFNAALGMGYGTCSTAEATVAKVVTMSNYKIAMNGYATVKFTYNVPANATMNINNEGARAIYYRGSAITANKILAGDLATFIYDGSTYQLIGIDRISINYSESNTTLLSSINSVKNSYHISGNLNGNQLFVKAEVGFKPTSDITVSTDTEKLIIFNGLAQISTNNNFNWQDFQSYVNQSLFHVVLENSDGVLTVKPRASYTFYANRQYYWRFNFTTMAKRI